MLHFGSTPLYALIANLLDAPLLAPLTLSALCLALLSLFVPSGVLLALGLIPRLVPQLINWRRMVLLPLFASVLVQGLVQCRDELVIVQRFDNHLLLARRHSEAHGHGRLDWVTVLDPVATDAQACWRTLARWVQSPQLGHPPLALGQQLFSEGLELELLADRGQLMLLRIGAQRWRLFPRPQALWAAQHSATGVHHASKHQNGLGSQPSPAQRSCLEKNGVQVGH